MVFMDIQLADGLSFEIFAQIHVESPVIFTTSFDEFALQAFKVHSIDYLLKPINKEDLQRSLAKYEHLQRVYATQRRTTNKLDTAQNHQQKHQQNHAIEMTDNQTDFAPDANTNITRLVEQLIQVHREEKSLRLRLLVQQGNKMMPLSQEEIAFITSENKLTYITTHDGKRYIKNSSLDELEALLPHETFFRINRQFIVQVNAVVGIHSQPSGKFKVQLAPPPASNAEEGRDTFVSRERLADFKLWLGK
jgi:two-component system, LytTR family, response regulator LytT